MKQPLHIGILGGGQLGRMLLQAAANYPVVTHVLENEEGCPASGLCNHFTKGDICHYDTVYQFGKQMDVVTIEIENVNIDALEQLEREGVAVIPRPAALRIIKDKGLQKQFYRDHHIATAPYILTDTAEDVKANAHLLPAAHKLRTGGYDGKGVELIHTVEVAHKAFNEPSVLESMVQIEKEISVIVACGTDGETSCYPAVEMVFNPSLNLVEYLVSPANLTPVQAQEAAATALKVAKALNSPGIFAVEMFLSTQGEILVNETAPRAHNSGHQTIEGNFCSQYDMQMRIFQHLPLGNTAITYPSGMLNLLGAEGHSGPVVWQGLNEALKIEGVYVHLYGKTVTKPGRKMGHISVLAGSTSEVENKLQQLKNTVVART